MPSRKSALTPVLGVLLTTLLSLPTLAAPAPPKKPAAVPAKAAAKPVGTPPVITHAPVTKVELGAVAVLTAKIVDEQGVFEPKLFARSPGKSAFVPFNFEKVDGDDYRVEVPPGVFAGGSFTYYIEAYDADGNGPARVASAAQPVEVIASLPPAKPVRVSLRTEPDGADLELDGKPAGKSPYSAELMPGAHVFVIRASGRKALEQRLQLVQGRDVEVFAALRVEGGTGKLRVVSVPPGATVFVDGTPAGVTPAEFPGLSGKHKLRVSLDGHLPDERQVKLEKGVDSEVAFALQKLPDEPALAVESQPSGATLLIDGKERGTTPWIGIVDPGEHEAVLRGADGREVASNFSMPVAQGLLLRLTLPEPRADNTAALVVMTEPAGADLSIDGKMVGRTPWIGAAPAADATLSLKLKGFKPLSKKFSFDGKRDRELTFALEREGGQPVLVITARQADAVFSLDGLELGTGPLGDLPVDPGGHVITAAAPGRQTIGQRVMLESGQRLSVSFDLPAADPTHKGPGAIVESKPTGAIVKVDGKEVGKTPLARVDLTPGKHVVEVLAAGHETYRADVNVPDSPAFELRVSAALVPSTGLRQAPSASKEDFVNAQLERGIECFTTKAWACSADAFQRAYDIDSDPDYLYQVAISLSNLGQWKDAGAKARETAARAKAEKLKKEATALADTCDANAASATPVAAPAPGETNPGPTLDHEPLKLAWRLRPVRLVAGIRDPDGIFLPRACWKNLLNTEYNCAELQAGANNTYFATVPGEDVSEGFSYYLEVFDLQGNGPTVSGTHLDPHRPQLGVAPTTSSALAGVTTAEGEESEGDEEGSGPNVVSLAVTGLGAVAAIAGGVLVGVGASMVAGDSIDPVTGVHSTTQKVAADARGLVTVGSALLGVGLVGVGVGLFVLPGGGGDEESGDEGEGSGGGLEVGVTLTGRF